VTLSTEDLSLRRPLSRLTIIASSVVIGAALGLLALPAWGPALASSLVAGKASWYLSRASGLVAYVLLWMSVTAGLLSSSGIGRRLCRGPAIYDVHRHAAWLGLTFAAFHALVLMGDRHVGGDLVALLVPFAMARHARGWVALGQLALYGGVLVALSFRLRGKLGARTWRALHFASFTIYVIALAHGLLAGTDASAPAVLASYAASGAVVAMLTMIRLFEAKR
jgi:predicted ferric reductase